MDLVANLTSNVCFDHLTSWKKTLGCLECSTYQKNSTKNKRLLKPGKITKHEALTTCSYPCQFKGKVLLASKIDERLIIQ